MISVHQEAISRPRRNQRRAGIEPLIMAAGGCLALGLSVGLAAYTASGAPGPRQATHTATAGYWPARVLRNNAEIIVLILLLFPQSQREANNNISKGIITLLAQADQRHQRRHLCGGGRRPAPAIECAHSQC